MKFNKKRLTALALSAILFGSAKFSLIKTAYASNVTIKIKNSQQDSAIQNYNVKSHKVAVVTKKLDENGNNLKGATLQIIDSNGIILDEWISDGNEHISMIPEGKYILHEKLAPNGYKLANDKEFEIKVTADDINAGVVHDDGKDVCWHYGGVALYYIEIEGKKEEVYCINQGWEEPDNTNYDGVILDKNNIKMFMPDADPNMTNIELYNKVLDIIYHRSIAKEMFPNLSETAIRYITEYALKNYTSAMVDNGTLFRRYRYDSSVNSKFVEDLNNGDAIGQLAKHWWYYHGKQSIPDDFVSLYYYLISENEPHPEDMFLYVYSTKNMTSNNENFQNLLGITWFNPNTENYEIDFFNEPIPTPTVTPTITPTVPKTGDNFPLIPLSLTALTTASLSAFIGIKNKVKRKVR